MRFITFCTIFLFNAALINAQNSPPPQYSDPMTVISYDIRQISVSVQKLSDRLKEFVDKFEKVGGVSMTEKQQKLILGLEILVRAEQRVATLQKFQIDLVEKQGTSRTRLAQVERDLLPQSIERSTAFEGSTKTEEIREGRRNALQAERASLQTLLTQINTNLADANEAAREALFLVQRLRRTFLPQIEMELSGQQ